MDVMLGQYRVTGTIGHGGMGIVYAAEHSLLGKPAAIKVLQAELSQKQEAVTRFLQRSARGDCDPASRHHRDLRLRLDS